MNRSLVRMQQRRLAEAADDLSAAVSVFAEHGLATDAAQARHNLGYTALLRGDLHSHSDWSDGTTPIAAMVKAARELGREYLALTDHSPRLRVANGLSAQRLREQIPIVESFRDDRFTLLTGIEVDILGDGGLDQQDDLLRSLDIVVASVHSKTLKGARSPLWTQHLRQVI